MRLLASLLCFVPFLAHIYCEDVFGIVGENFTFPVKIDQKVVETTWKKNKDKVAEWEGLNKPTYFGRLCNRSVLMENGSLTIVDLEKDDAGAYELQYRDSMKDHYLNFVLVVLDPLPEPEISCNTSDRKLVLNCAANFQGPLNYIWKLSDNPQSHEKQELSIRLEDVNATTKATCIIKFLQMERSSEISLMQCLSDENGGSSSKRTRGALFGACILIAVVVLVFLFYKGIINFGRGRNTAQNSPVNGSGEHEQLFHGDSQQQPTSQGATFSQAVHNENEEPEADRELNEEDSALKDKQIVKNGVNQEDTFRNSSVLANHADEHGINEGEVTQDAEGRDGEHLNNSSSCSKEDLKSKASNSVAAHTNMEEKR
ncbi:lymphocyte function-associated antigen 3 isoform X1 [Corvus cornix cornix]|uniref:lymphocyte function-associated antigen 3 isoform X1 n=1 Tax=Corvus cornix cornix TaxID=932674 RepID=UPI00194FC14C|nr:lymphocyte function-associated antigen 3 isoform X1 [Corvus cornix cornix]